MGIARTPVVFIHGLWLHAESWKNWIEFFRQAGYEPIAPPWPGIPATVTEARASVVPGRVCQPQPVRSVEGRYGDCGPWPPPAHRGREGSHGASGNHQSDPPAVP